MFGSIFGVYRLLIASTMASYGHGRGVVWSVKICQIFRPRSGPKIRLTMCSHYYAATTPILPVQRPILFHSVNLECMCNLGRCHSIYWPSNVGCQIGCISIDRRQMRRFRQKKTHITKSPLPPWCITWHYWQWNTPLQYLQHTLQPKILCWIRFWRRRGLNLNGYGRILTLTQDM